MENYRLKLKCPTCDKNGTNAFPHPFEWGECIGMHHSPRSDNEYYWKCPHCGQRVIYPNPPYDMTVE